jgi:hypothetical protein
MTDSTIAVISGLAALAILGTCSTPSCARSALT